MNKRQYKKIHIKLHYPKLWREFKRNSKEMNMKSNLTIFKLNEILEKEMKKSGKL